MSFCPMQVVAREAIRLLFIPYESGWVSQKIPLNTFTGPVAPPPPPQPPQADRDVPQSIEGDDVGDDDWLIDG